MRIVEQQCNCNIQVMPITDYSETSTLYHPTWKDSGVFTMIYKVNKDNTETLIDTNLSVHMIDCQPQREVYELSNLKDGWYKVRSYILPTKSFLETLGMTDGYDDTEYQIHWLLFNKDNAFNDDYNMTLGVNSEGVCFQARKSSHLPYETSGKYYWVLVEDICDLIEEIELRGIKDGLLYGTNVSVIEEDIFITCNLKRKYIDTISNLIYEYKNCPLSTNWCDSKEIDLATILMRDYLWMVINAIKYAVECEDYQTANCLLDCITNSCEDEIESKCGCS